MPDLKISGLTAVSGICTDTSLIPVADVGLNFKATRAQLQGYTSVKDYGAVGDGVTDDTAAINTALAACILTNSKRLYFPSANYSITKATGVIFNIASNNVEVFGDGVGKSIITFAANTTLTGQVTVFNFTGYQQTLHDLTFVGGTGLNGPLTPASVVVSAAGTGYVPGDSITTAGGTFSSAAVLSVTTTKVVSATVAAGGSGGTNGTQTVTGTTGTGTPFQASVTVSGNAITAVLSITVKGSYTVNPTVLTAEPVTGAGLVGAQLSVVMGVNAATMTSGGSYTFPNTTAGSVNIYSQGSTTGVGVGATFNLDASSGMPGLIFHAIASGAFRSRSYNLDISGIWGLHDAGGAGITCGQGGPQTNETSTTLGTAVGAPGVATVTPPSMALIYPGRILRIGGASPETLEVTSTTATTFTATFANTHLSTDTVGVWSLAAQYNLIENLYIHDSYCCSATIFNSGSNIVRGMRVVNCGAQANQHGIYDQQGGRNIFEDCYVEGQGGFSYHVHIAVNSVASASGNRFINCYSVNPGAQHLYIDSTNSNNADPDVPNATPLQRYSIIHGCVFKCTVGAQQPSTGVGVSIQAPGAMISDCIFEDACPTGGTWLQLVGNGTNGTNQTARGCTFRQMNSSGAPIGVGAGNNCILEGNQFVNWNFGNCVKVNAPATGQCVLKGNGFQYSVAGQGCIVLGGGNNVIIADNQGTVGTGSTSSFITVTAASVTGLDIHDNNIVLSGGSHFFRSIANKPTGIIHHNIWTGSTGGVSYTDTLTGLDFEANNGFMNFNNTTTNTLALDSQAGHLLRIAPGTNTLTGGLAANVAQTGNCLTSDTIWSGFSPCNKDATSGNFYVAGWAPGQIVRGVTADGACTAGNVLVLSGTVAGNLHDSASTTPPAAPASYAICLTTTGGAGPVDVRVMRAQ